MVIKLYPFTGGGVFAFLRQAKTAVSIIFESHNFENHIVVLDTIFRATLLRIIDLFVNKKEILNKLAKSYEYSCRLFRRCRVFASRICMRACDLLTC